MRCPAEGEGRRAVCAACGAAIEEGGAWRAVVEQPDRTRAKGRSVCMGLTLCGECAEAVVWAIEEALEEAERTR